MKHSIAKELTLSLKLKARSKKMFLPATASLLTLYLFILSGCSNNSNDINVLFAGDLMLDRGVRGNIEKRGMDYLFEDIKTIFKTSDIAIANLECVVCDTSLKPKDKKFTFRANPEWLYSLHENGITHVNLANNHSLDFGEKGIKQTTTNLKQSNINSIGYNPCGDSSCLPTLIKRNGSNIAIFSSCFLKQNSNFICNENASALSKRIKVFKETNPSCIVFVCLHWGVEMDLNPTTEQVTEAHLLIDSGADAIIGHHPHVVQTIEKYKGKYIFYSIGNFIFDKKHPPANRGIFAVFLVTKGRIKPVQIIPFNILQSKIGLMSEEESKKYMNEIDSISQTLDFIQNDGNWNVL